ncbi:MAG: hypothetical protein J0H64_02215 [Actinobacteria bacterium]|nr:hypothetical protein [Actinomycetota bacterium]
MSSTESTDESMGEVAAAEAVATEAGMPDPVETDTQMEVALVRSVRYGPIIVAGTALGAVIAAIAALFFPVAPDAEYELGQAVGVALVVGAVIGLTLSALLTLLLGRIAKRNQGAALAVLTDVK